jgi:predicted phosphate transport protein (TIGR00153 family)
LGSVAAPSPAARVRSLFGRAPDYGGLLDLFAAAGANVERGTTLLADLLAGWPERADLRHDLVDCEHEGDRLTHDIVHHLKRRNAVPIDGSDLLTLASRIDDVVDFAEEVGDVLHLYDVEAPMEQAIALGEVLRKAGAEIATALSKLDEPASLRPYVARIGELERDADRIEREALSSLFRGGIDPMVVIRWKDLFERLEEAADSCKRVAHVLEGIQIRQA